VREKVVLECKPAKGAEETCADDGAVFHEVKWEEGSGCEVVFPETESDEKKDAEDDHSDDGGGGPALLELSSQAEW
jgi:hypothetical protein